MTFESERDSSAIYLTSIKVKTTQTETYIDQKSKEPE